MYRPEDDKRDGEQGTGGAFDSVPRVPESPIDDDLSKKV